VALFGLRDVGQRFGVLRIKFGETLLIEMNAAFVAIDLRL
jgi:hypothetical protein